MEASVAQASGVGPMVRAWRQRRHLSQLELALDAGVSARHLSFIETGRARPSPEMILRLAEQLEIPLRQRNRLMLAAGYAPAFAQRELDDPEMAPIRRTLERILAAHDPYPALVVNGEWELVASNRGMAMLLEGVSAELLEPPVNVYRVALHPEGMARSIVNLDECRRHLLDRLRRQIALSGDPALETLHAEVSSYGPPADRRFESVPADANGDEASELAVPVRMRRPDGSELAFISTLATFGSAVEVTASELSIESFFPLDDATADAVREYARSLPAG